MESVELRSHFDARGNEHSVDINRNITVLIPRNELLFINLLISHSTSINNAHFFIYIELFYMFQSFDRIQENIQKWYKGITKC
jgi:hypothetical protein